MNAKTEKEKRIKREKNKLKKIFQEVSSDETTRKYLENAIGNAAFIAVLLEDLREDILENGWTEEYKNGENQYGKKDSVAVKTYNVVIRNYTTLIKTLANFLPASNSENGEDKLAQFLMGKEL